MNQHEQLLSFCAGSYDAALNPSTWSEMLARVASCLGAIGADLHLPPKMGAPSGEMLALVKAMQPHLGRALSAQFHMMDAELRNHVYTDALDRLACGVAIINGAGKLMLSNAAAQAVFEQGLTLKLVQERLTAALPAESRKLQAQIQHALTGSDRRGGAIIVHGPAQRALSVTVDAASEQFRSRTGGAAYIYITDIHARPARARAQQVREMFGFTPAETRIAVGIADGETVQDVAARVGVTYESARFTLKRVYEKLGVHKQGELVALIRGALPPLRDTDYRHGS